MAAYTFDLKLLCGSYAYFSTFTHWIKEGEHGREFRKPSLVDIDRFQNTLSLLGKRHLMVTDKHELEVWLYLKGWAIVPKEVAHSLMPQWLKAKECVRSSLKIFTDVEIVSPSALSRSTRGARRNFIFERDNKSCLLCESTTELTMQHVIPYSRGGETTARNPVTLCRKCNEELGVEYLPSLYESAMIHQGYDPSLINNAVNFDVILAARSISSNLMQSRCEVW